MALIKSNSYTTSDGKTFVGVGRETQLNAAKHQRTIDRTSRVKALLEANETSTSDISAAEDLDTLARAIASLGDDLITALNVPSGRGPNKPKTPVAA